MSLPSSISFFQPYQITGTLANGQTYVDSFTIQYNYDSSTSSRPSSSVVSNVNLSVNGSGNFFSSNDYLGGSYATVNGTVGITSPGNTVTWTNAANNPSAFSVNQLFGADGTNLQSISATSGNLYLPSGTYEQIKFNINDANAFVANGSVAPDAAGGVGSLISINANTQNGAMSNVTSTSYDFFKTLTVADTGSTHALNSSGNFDKGLMSVTSVSAATSIVCFAKGSLIAAMDGELPTELAVEKLKVGDKVLTISGNYEKIVWIGHRRVNCNKHSDPTQAWPVKVSKDAFGAGMPTQDLYLSPAHSVYVYGHLVPIQHLVNGITITQEERPTVTYYHIELAQHSVIYAQGLPSETFLDSLNRQFFIEGNDAKIATLDLNEVEFAESARDHYLEHCYAPFVTEGPVLEAIFAKVLAKAGQSALMMAA